MQAASADFDFRVDIDDFKAKLVNADLTFVEKQQLALKVIDKNQLYYQYSEIDDEDVRKLISDGDFEFNKKFYGGKVL